MAGIRFRYAAPAALLVMLVSMPLIDIDPSTAGESKRPERRQAAERTVGAPKKQAAGVGAGSGGAVAPPTTQASPADTAGRDTSTAKPDSAGRHAKPAKAQAKGQVERDSTARKPQAEKEDVREEAPLRGPRLPIWPGISDTNPSAGRDLLAAAW